MRSHWENIPKVPTLPKCVMKVSRTRTQASHPHLGLWASRPHVGKDVLAPENWN